MAGLADRVAAWVHVDDPLTQVVQTQDSLDGLQADFLLDSGRPLQFTYGYLSSGLKSGRIIEPQSVIQAALARNTDGAVIVSSRRPDRVAALARAAS